MDAESRRVLMYGLVIAAAYFLLRNKGPGPARCVGCNPMPGVRAYDPLTSAPIAPESWNQLTSIRASGQAGGSL